MGNIDILSIIIIAIFLLPIIFGAFRKHRENGFFKLINGILYAIEILLCLVLSVYLSKMIFFENSSGVFKSIYDFIPDSIKNSLIGNNFMILIFVIPVIFIFSLIVISFITSPLVRYAIEPFSEFLEKKTNKLKGFGKNIVSALLEVPTGLCFVIIAVVLLNVYSYFNYNPYLKNIMSSSVAYKFIYNTAVLPVLESNIAKKIPVLVNDSFKKSDSDIKTDNDSDGIKIKTIEYFNGVTINEAVKSNAQIDAKAREIIQSASTDAMKGYLIYKWISENIYYDYDKANRITKKLNNIKSGSIIAFDSRKGICFDYSCLFVSMCRAVNLRVRLITGLANSGLSWGDHSWNEVYSSEENRWIKVDTTFGKAANYFDNPGFGNDHSDREMQQQW